MKIAVSKNTLSVPPTYFAVQHALTLQQVHTFRYFTGAADIGDAAIAARLDIFDATRSVPMIAALDGLRQRAAPLFGGIVSRAIRRWEPALIHQHFANMSGAAVDAAAALRVPLLLTVHGADVFVPLTDPRTCSPLARPALRSHQIIVARAFSRADRILAVSKYLAGVAIHAGADPAKVVVHYQGVDTEFYRPQPATPAGVPRIVSVSALSEAKGTRDLIEASISLARHRPHELILVGDGPLRPVADAAAAEHPHIYVRGRLDREGVRRELSNAAAFALPTKRSGIRRESAGLVILEAQASGVPVIVYDSGGSGEMLEDGVTGSLIAEGDVAAMADALGEIIALTDAERANLGRRAREWVVAQRSLKRSAQQLDTHYRELLG